jgi:hypothetical protein
VVASATTALVLLVAALGSGVLEFVRGFYLDW